MSSRRVQSEYPVPFSSYNKQTKENPEDEDEMIAFITSLLEKDMCEAQNLREDKYNLFKEKVKLLHLRYPKNIKGKYLYTKIMPDEPFSESKRGSLNLTKIKKFQEFIDSLELKKQNNVYIIPKTLRIKTIKFLCVIDAFQKIARYHYENDNLKEAYYFFKAIPQSYLEPKEKRFILSYEARNIRRIVARYNPSDEIEINQLLQEVGTMIDSDDEHKSSRTFKRKRDDENPIS